MQTYGKWIFWGLVALAVFILLAVLFWPSAPAETPVPAPTLPSAASSGDTTNSGRTLSLTGKLGTITMNDFLHNGMTEADPLNEGLYFVAGSPGYCIPEGPCPHGAPATEYVIVYDSKRQFFTITLLAEPLGQARARAEQFLLNSLGVSESQLCALNYYAGILNGLNDRYGDRNLGFSFCPGATVLPE